MPDGKKILVKGGVLPGSIVDIMVVKKTKDYLEAHVISTQKYDAHFADGEVFCPHFYISKDASSENNWTAKIGCWGCKWQMMSYLRQLELKQWLVEESFKKINSKLEQKIWFLPILGSPLTQWYRNKIEFSFGVFKQWTKEYNQLRKQSKNMSEDSLAPQFFINSPRTCWFHKQWEFSKIVDINSCYLISEKANQIFAIIKDLCFNSWLPTYDQKTHQWFFRHLVIREGVNTGQLMVNLSVSLTNLDDEQTKLWEELLEQFKVNPTLKQQITTFIITYNDWLADTIKNEKSEMKVFWGDGYIHEKLVFKDWEITFRISPFSFFQTNTHGAELLFSTAFKMLWNFKGNIIDLYCGTWSIWLSLLKLKEEENSDSQLIWIEIVEDAIIDANINAEINALSNQSFFISSPAEKALENHPELADKIQNVWVIVIDPPRDGLHKNVIEWISNIKKEYDFQLLYISCNSVTMARDIELFMEKGFKIREIQPVDMFPHTHHCECIGVLS